ncbi:response regulator [Chitinimonas prasina]|uniref:response regulator n=1 Tax=Chitinimonas prasina TaxID=1434937 RepID=UPI0024E07BD6|nr:response regulator transcription factor [Chitinimonas prasina]
MIADDHLLVRKGIRTLVEELGHEVVAEVDEGIAAVAAVLALKPDLALVDIAMPGLSGIEVVLRVAVSLPGVRLLYLSGLSDKEAVIQALRAGADGYLLKDFLLDDLAVALQTVMRGERYVSPSLPVAIHQALEGSEEPLLTSRQIEVLRGLADGLTLKQIARAMNVSPKTVEFHRAKLSERLGIRDIPGLARYAARMGLVGGR